ncbi:MAG: cobyrinate a,c-diamide synthase [Nitrospirota bacterium]
MKLPRLIVAGTHSGVGKTTVTLALTLALRDSNLPIQPFKVGPDYLDPTYHTLAAARPCRNLDGWMMGESAVRQSLTRASTGASLALIEGVMGLYDGAGLGSEVGSTAQMAKWLRAPVILVIDASGMATTAAALALGCVRYDSDVPWAGVIFNRVGSERHLAWLREAVERTTQLKVLGGLPVDSEIGIPERHLGLVGADRSIMTPDLNKRLVDLARQWFDLKTILQAAGDAPQLDASPIISTERPRHCRIGVARDEAFSFYYLDNLELLEAAGAELVPFSPLHDESLPPELDGLYLGGGYPELYGQALAAGEPMREAITAFARRGDAVYAECGGLMYLSQVLHTLDGARHRMVGLLPGEIRMLQKRKTLGYREVEAVADLPILAKGERARGHEFHYSEWIDEAEPIGEWSRPYCLLDKTGRELGREGWHRRNVVASYVHLHFGSNPTIVRRWCDALSITHNGKRQ